MATKTTTKKVVAPKKIAYCEKLVDLLNTHSKILLVTADNVGSKHLQEIRIQLRGEATLLMGKNTMIRRALREGVEANPAWESLLHHVRGNLGFFFTNGDVASIRKRILANKVGAPAKAGGKAPCDVHVNKGPTGMDPTQTSFFQALNIATMISRGQIEIKQDVHLIKEGERVGASEAALLSKLNIRPFAYGLQVPYVFDEGMVFDADILDISQDDIVAAFTKGLRTIAGLSMRVGIPTAAAVPHQVADAFKHLLAVSVMTDYTFKEAEAVKNFLADPSAFATVTAPTADAAAPAEEAPAVEPSDDDEPTANLFGGGDDEY